MKGESFYFLLIFLAGDYKFFLELKITERRLKVNKRIFVQNEKKIKYPPLFPSSTII